MVMPQVPVVTLPVPPVLPQMTILPNQAIQASTNVKVYDIATASLVEYNTNQLIQLGNGWVTAPAGWTFVTLADPSFTISPSTDSGLEVLDSTEEFKKELETITPEEIVAHSRSASPCPQESKAPQNKKYRHRSKQIRIDEVHEELRVKYTAKGLYAGDDEVLRGFDTVRVHVKTFHALNEIKFPLQDIENDSRVQILKIATPFSMKNRYQKKGFIVYLKLASSNQVEVVQSIFAKYKEHFAKCDIALRKEDKEKVSSISSITANDGDVLPILESQKVMEHADFSDWSLPPRMNKQRSIGA